MSGSLHLITGNDSAGIAAAARGVVTSLAGENPDPWSMEIIREREGAAPGEALRELLVALLSPSFPGQTKTLWLRNFGAFDAEGGKAKTGEAPALAKLAEVLAAGVPDGINLVLSGPEVDPAKRLYAACSARGTVKEFRLPDAAKDRNWRSQMTAIVRQRATAKGLKLTDGVIGYLVEALGTDTLRLDNELEKLVCYLGSAEKTVSLMVVEDIIRGEGETLAWGVRDAVCRRNLEEAMRVLETTLGREKDEDSAVHGLVLALFTQFRLLLKVRVFMQELKQVKTSQQVRSALQNMADEAKAKYLDRGFDFVYMNPGRVGYLVDDALRFSGPELVQAIRLLRDANWKCVSASCSKRLVLESVIRQLTGPGTRQAP